MSIWTRTNEEHRRARFWRTAPQDPTRPFKDSGTPYFRAGKNRVLMPHDFMPVGTHAGKHLRAVPMDYLLWVDAQPWSRFWTAWEPVHDYLTRHVPDPADAADGYGVPTTPILFVDRLRKWPTKIKVFEAGSAHLHTLPGHEDLLHAFAVGALGLSVRYYQRGQLPHYDLTRNKHGQAMKHGAIQITDQQMIENKNTWLQFYQTKR